MDPSNFTIGIAGVSIPGAVDCISKINQLSSRYFSDHAHPNILFYQPNFSPIEQALQNERWDVILDSLLESVNILAKAGADFVIVPANTVHKVIFELQQKSPIPVLNILEIAAKECQRRKIKRVGIMGSSWTMANHLYREILQTKGMEECVPSKTDQQVIQRAILSELIPTGKVAANTLSSLFQVVKALKEAGCDGIVLACTELPLVLNEANCEIPTLDTTALLAEAALLHLTYNRKVSMA